MGRLVTNGWAKARPLTFLAPSRYRLSGQVRLEVGREGSGWFVEVPAGYEFDLSAPWPVRWMLPVHHLVPATAVHDYARHQLGWPLRFGNLLFLDAMDAAGVREPARTACWLAVRTSTRRD